MNTEHNYKRDIEPIVDQLLEKDDQNAEANRGQMQEIVKELVLMLSYDTSIGARLLSYGFHLRDQKIRGDAEG